MNHKVKIILTVAVTLLACVGGAVYYRMRMLSISGESLVYPEETEVQETEAMTQTAQNQTTVCATEGVEDPEIAYSVTEPETIQVYVCGAVEVPGVYALKAQARVFEAVELAGGLTQEADPDQVNQARLLTDGEKIYIPRKGEETVAVTAAAGTGQSGTGSTAGTGSININTASLSELISLPGIGESKAQSIIDYRTEHGAFASTEDIKSVSGIGEAIYSRIADRICVE